MNSIFQHPIRQEDNVNVLMFGSAACKSFILSKGNERLADYIDILLNQAVEAKYCHIKDQTEYLNITQQQNVEDSFCVRMRGPYEFLYRDGSLIFVFLEVAEYSDWLLDREPLVWTSLALEPASRDFIGYFDVNKPHPGIFEAVRHASIIKSKKP